MSRKKKSIKPAPGVAEVAEVQVATERQAPPPRAPRYIGPRYQRGIVLPDGRLVKPRDMQTAQIESLIAAWPPAAAWWK